MSPLSPASNQSLPELDAQKALSALGNSLRWQIVQMMADGSALHASAVARELDRDFDGVSKHMRILRSAGVLKSRRAKDRRVEKYFIPAEYRETPGQIELGFCVLRIKSAKPDKAETPDNRFSDFEEIEEAPVQGFGEMLVSSASRGSN